MSSPGSWRLDAVCAGVDPDRFGPDLQPAQAAATILAFCHHCPVIAECRQAAEQGGECGVWGGLFFTLTGHRRGRGVDELLPSYDKRNYRVKPRGVCRGCGHVRSLKFGGRVAMHRVDGKRCSGTDCPPAREAS